MASKIYTEIREILLSLCKSQIFVAVFYHFNERKGASLIDKTSERGCSTLWIIVIMGYSDIMT